MNVKGAVILGGIGFFCVACVFIVIDLQEQSAKRTGTPGPVPIVKYFTQFAEAVGREVAYGDYTDQWGTSRYGPICPSCRNPVNQGSTSCGRGCLAYRWVGGSCRHCDGKGTVICRKCDGKGSATNYSQCSWCTEFNRANCKKCKGTAVAKYEWICHDCGKSGSQPCTYCRGVGRWS